VLLNTYFHSNVEIKCLKSSLKNLFTGAKESSLGVTLKYKAPRKKCFTLSVAKNWLEVAAFPFKVK